MIMRTAKLRLLRLTCPSPIFVRTIAKSRNEIRCKITMPRLAGKVVVLTGASSGIGRATALALAAEQAILHLVARRQDRLEEVCAEARRLGAHATPHMFDVRDASGVARLGEHIRAEHGVIDILINNAGVGVTKTFLESTDDDWDWTLAVNLYGVVYAIREFLPMMLERGRGTIVNVASLAGITGSLLSAYAASKSAIVGLSESLMIEYGDQGLDVIVVCPGAIKTEIATAAMEVGRTNTTLGTKLHDSLQRFGVEPEVVAADIVRALHHPRFLVMTPMHASVIRTLHRLFPSLSRSLTRRLGG